MQAGLPFGVEIWEVLQLFEENSWPPMQRSRLQTDPRDSRSVRPQLGRRGNGGQFLLPFSGASSGHWSVLLVGEEVNVHNDPESGM